MAFQLKSDKKETVNKTVRFPQELVFDIEKVLRGKDTSFSGFVVQACQYALNDMKDQNHNLE